jgi:hypothetical protein
MKVKKSDLFYVVAKWCIGHEISATGFEQLIIMIEDLEDASEKDGNEEK